MINKSITTIAVMSFIIVFLTLISRQQHIIPTLLCLEGLILLLIYLLPSITNNQIIIITSSIVIILTINVSRARIGLALLVITRRNQGNDSSLNYSTYIC